MKLCRNLLEVIIFGTLYIPAKWLPLYV